MDNQLEKLSKNPRFNYWGSVIVSLIGLGGLLLSSHDMGYNSGFASGKFNGKLEYLKQEIENKKSKENNEGSEKTEN